jgi:hypothetical protein
MRQVLFSLLFAAAAFGQQGRYAAFPPQPPPAAALSNALTASPATEIPTWGYSVTAGADLGGATYTGTIVGRSPLLRGKTTTTIPLQIVPVKIVINNGPTDNVTYDPLVNDGCEPAGHSAVDIVQNSPIFTNNTWVMNGVNVGNTQYIDAFVRASFWNPNTAGTAYHLLANVTVLPEITMNFGTAAGGSLGHGTNYNVPGTFGGGCGNMGVVFTNDLVAAVNNALAANPAVNIGTLPMILANAVVSDDSASTTGQPNIFGNCCVLGFHSGYNVGANLQVTSIFNLDYSGLFGNMDVTVISHELSEAIFDPTINNQTPPWGNIGQTVGPYCQDNFEVGDPLSPGFGTPTSEWVVPGANGITYHLQELAFFNWFYGGTNMGAGGKYSDHGSFGGNAILCSLGGGSH